MVFKKGNIPWNKRMKMKDMIKVNSNCAKSGFLKGHIFFGNRKIISKHLLDKNGNTWNKGTKGLLKSNKTSFKKGKDNKNFGKDWSNMKGESHWNWKGGITPEIMTLRNSAKYQIWRNLVYLRDDFTCQNISCEYCKNKRGVYLHAHHIKSFAKYPELRFKIDNGITYCGNYHAKLEVKIRKGTALIIG